ncbi:MAG: SH3 domain-containing protein, partial [Chloroflexi bacterium]|nr:SH3 domain-containing protein [Chloroflexota bacterium]
MHIVKILFLLGVLTLGHCDGGDWQQGMPAAVQPHPATPARPTQTPTPILSTPTATPTPRPHVRADVRSLRLRTGPGSSYSTICGLAGGTPLLVHGRDADGRWLQVTSDQGSG